MTNVYIRFEVKIGFVRFLLLLEFTIESYFSQSNKEEQEEENVKWENTFPIIQTAQLLIIIKHIFRLPITFILIDHFNDSIEMLNDQIDS